MQVIRHLAVLLTMIVPLTGCVSIASDACTDVGTAGNNVVLNAKDVTPRNCDGGFLSARRQRDVLYAGDDKPRLRNGEAERRERDIDTAKVNAPPLGYAAPGRVTGYMGTMRINFEADEDAVAADVAALQNAAGSRFDPDQKVTIDFRKASIDYVLKQMLGAALGVNYLAPEDLGGSITFRTEAPIAKSQVLQVVRDILARNGLEIRSINGVYHVGKPELIESIAATGAAGRAGEKATKILRIRRGAGGDLLALAKQIVPPNVELLATNSSDTIILRAGAGEIDQVEKLLKGLVANGVSEERVAVIPLRQSAPDKIAGQMMEFFRSRNAGSVNVIPLDGQQALLVSAKDASMIEGAKRLAEAMDTEVRDEISLRLLPLQHLAAEEIAQRLATIFGSGGAGGPVPSGNGSAAFGGAGGLAAAGSPSSNFGQSPGQSTDRLRDPAPLPRLSPTSAGDGETNGFVAPTFSPRNGNFAAGPVPGLPGAGAGAGGGLNGVTRIIADKNTNALMVYSSYSLFKKIRDVLHALDVPPAQVVIEATIVEVDLTDQLQQGVQFFLSGTGFVVGSGSATDVGISGTSAVAGSTTPTGGAVGTPTSSSLGGVSSSAGFGGLAGIGVNLGNGLRADAVLRALQGITRVKVISSPYLTVLNGKQARLVIGDQIPYAQRSQSANNLGNTTVTQEIIIKDTGIILDVTPRIQANNSVALKVNQSVSIPQQSVLAGNLTPVISTRSVESDILLQSGRTVLLGGLIQDRLEQQEDGVPVLRTLPVVGDIFKQKTDNTRRVELILMLTPRVTRNSSQIEDLTRLLQAQMHTR